MVSKREIVDIVELVYYGPALLLSGYLCSGMAWAVSKDGFF